MECKFKIAPDVPQNENGLTQMIMMGESIRQIGLKRLFLKEIKCYHCLLDLCPCWCWISVFFNIKIIFVVRVILRLHYSSPGGHGGHVSDNREQNGITVRQRRGTG